MNFKDIIGQPKVKTLLQQLAGSDRIPHALLFLGNTGQGNLALALTFAQLLQCESSDRDANDPEPCGVCPACRKAAIYSHPDIHYSFPSVGANAVSTNFLKEWRQFLHDSPYGTVNDWLQLLGSENKQGNITKDECNAIIKKLSLKTFEGKYKILIIWLPEYLGKEGNRLLKLIEEPPEQTIFLLVAENQDMILNTILSRCQLIKSDILNDDDIAEALIQNHQADPERAREIAFIADGDYGAAIAALKSEIDNNSALFIEWLRKCWLGNAVDLMKWTENFARLGREHQKQFLHFGLHFLREIMALVSTGNDMLRLRPQELETAKNMSKVLTFDKISRLTKLFNDNIYYVERNANPKILFMDSSLKMNRILRE